MKAICVWILVLPFLLLVVTRDASAAVIFTTGISSNTTSSPFNVFFQNYSGGGVTSINSQGLQIQNIDSTAGHEGDVTFSFSNVAFGASDYVKVYIERSTTGSGNTTAQVLSVDGTAVSSASVVTIATQGGLTGYNLPFTLSSADGSVSSVTIRFNIATGSATVSSALDIDAVATPEPGTLALMVSGLLAALILHRRRRKRRHATGLKPAADP